LRTQPITRVLIATLIACGLAGADLRLPAQSRPVPDQLNLPADLAKYKEWRTQLQSPAPVPLELWIRCVAPTPADWTHAREKYGPHTEHYIQVYANQIATETLRKGRPGLFPTGAVIAKEKLLGSPQGTVAGVAFMVKRGMSQFASTGGWEFAYYPRPDDFASTRDCVNCHRSVAPKDYVFGEYPSSGDPLSPSQSHSR